MQDRYNEATIEAVTTAYGVSYRLPRRNGFRNSPKYHRTIELICAFVAAVAMVIGITALVLDKNWNNAVSYVIPGFFVAAAALVLIVTSYLQSGWTEVRISMRGIRVIERIGLLRWTNRRGEDTALTELRIETNAKGAANGMPTVLQTRLVAELDHGKPLCLAKYYFPEVLREFAEILEAAEGAPIVEREASKENRTNKEFGRSFRQERNLVARDRAGRDKADRNRTDKAQEISDHFAQHARDDSSLPASGETIVAPDPKTQARGMRDHFARHARGGSSQPATSDAIVAHSGDELSIHFPSQRLAKGSKGIITAGIVWLLITLAIFIPMLFVSSDSLGNLAAMVVFFVTFAAIGVAMLVYGISIAKRSVYFDVVGESLVASRRTPFRGTQQLAWRRDEIHSITAQESGTEINDVPLYELVIAVHNGVMVKTHTFLPGQDTDEIRWVAHELRSALGMER